MRILHLATHLNRGGISQYILSVSTALLQKGHEVFVASSGGEMEKEFRDQGIQVANFPIRTKSELSPKIYLALPKFLQWIKKERIDLIHAHTRVTQVMASWTEWLAGKPVVTTAHGFYHRRLGRRLLPAWGKRVIAISNPVARHLLEGFHVPPERVRVIYNGIDFENLYGQFQKHDPSAVRKEYGIPEEVPVVGIIARLVEDKGHEYLFRAVKKLEEEFPALHLLVVGEGRHRRPLENLARELGLASRIYFTGNLRDISKPLAAMNIFALPAVWREGFGLSTVEAMACGKPIIATNIWALNTLIQNEVNGILVNPKDAEDLARAIRHVLKDKAFRERIGRAGQQTVEERFTLERMVYELESLYAEVFQNNKGH